MPELETKEVVWLISFFFHLDLYTKLGEITFFLMVDLSVTVTYRFSFDL